MNASAPGKLILSGEHAVVHGRPALVMAVDRQAQASLNTDDSGQCTLSAPNLLGTDSLPLSALPALKRKLDHRHEQFLEGALPIRKVLTEDIELAFYAMALLLDYYDKEPPPGLAVAMTSTLPLGSGMGSSAAVIAALLCGTSALLGIPLDRDTLFQWTWEVERLQHGHPSGVDPFIVVHGGLVRFQHGEAEALRPPRTACSLVLTSAPESSTGECVAAVSKAFPATAPIWERFGQTTDEMADALTRGMDKALQQAIRTNHRLLCQIGVVPDTVQTFIRHVEEHGGAAKICGAGSIRGNGAGVVWVTGDVPVAELCAAFGYTHFTASCQPQGAASQPDNA